MNGELSKGDRPEGELGRGEEASGELGTGPVPVAELGTALETPVEDALEQATEVPGLDEEDWPR